MTPKPRACKNAPDDGFARLAKALASPRRIELLDALAQRSRTVENVAHQTGMSVANASQHLRILRAVGLVQSEKDGLFVSYRIASAQVVQLLGALRELASCVSGAPESRGFHPHNPDLSDGVLSRDS